MIKKIKKLVNSFDIFDTLISRRVEPHDIFSIVETRSNIPGFRSARIQAEELSDGSFDDIYRQLGKLLNIKIPQPYRTENIKYNIKLEAKSSPLSESLAILDLNTLMELEIEAELENTIPILCNINLVQDGDILISDMYLPASVIHRLLSKNGFNKRCELFLSYAGKHHGYIYDLVQERYHVGYHLGDSEYSDIYMAGTRGIKGILSTVHKSSKLEDMLGRAGMQEIRSCFKEFRLHNPYTESAVESKLYDHQVRYNIPILIFLARELRDIMRTEKRDKLLLFTRDGTLLKKIIQWLYPDINCMLFHSSRTIHRSYNEDYKKYVARYYKHDTCLIFDMAGSFNSGRTLYMEIFGYLPRIHIFTYDNTIESYHGLTYSIFDDVNDCIEPLNTDIVGTLIGMSGECPIRAKLEFNEDHVRIQHSTVENFIKKYRYLRNSIDNVPHDIWKAQYYNLILFKEGGHRRNIDKAIYSRKRLT